MSLVIRLFASMFILGGGLALFFGMKGVFAARASQQWPTAPAKVISSTVTSQVGAGDGDGTTYHAEVLYEYYAGGQKRLSNRVMYGGYGSSDPSHAQSVANHYPVGAEVTAHYSPTNPSEAVIETGLKASALLGTGIPAVLLCVGLYGFIFLPGRIARRMQAEALSPLGGNSEEPRSLYPIRPMSKFWRWHVGIFVLTVGATWALQHWNNNAWWWTLPVLVGVLLCMHLNLGVRCPQCQRRLKPRAVPVPPENTFYLYECPTCRIAWDPYHVLSASSSA